MTRHYRGVASLIVAFLFSVALSQSIFAAPNVVDGFDASRASQKASVESLRLAVQQRLDELHKKGSFPGATVAIVLAAGSEISASTGLADVERHLAMKPSDRMLAGSIGKTYCAAVVLQLVQEGKINLDEKIEHWFGSDPWFGRLPNAHDIILRNLMTHSSGIPEHVLNKDFIAELHAKPNKVWKPEELVAYILNAKPLFPAGHGFSYADTNYILVGMIVERVTHRTLYGEVERRILRPLGLKNTIPSNSRTLPGVITGYSDPRSPFGVDGRTIVNGMFVVNPQMEWTGGGFASTPGDLARWAKDMYEARAFNRKMVGEMLNGVDATGRGGGKDAKYGLACQIRKTEFGISYGHGGWFPGYLSEMEYFPDYKIAVAIQFNTDSVGKLGDSLEGFVADFAGIAIQHLGRKSAQ